MRERRLKAASPAKDSKQSSSWEATHIVFGFFIWTLNFFFIITCFEFFGSSHDLLEIARLVFDQFNPFWNCYSMPMQNQMAEVRKNKLQDGSNTSQERAT